MSASKSFCASLSYFISIVSPDVNFDILSLPGDAFSSRLLILRDLTLVGDALGDLIGDVFGDLVRSYDTRSLSSSSRLALMFPDGELVVINLRVFCSFTTGSDMFDFNLI